MFCGVFRDWEGPVPMTMSGTENDEFDVYQCEDSQAYDDLFQSDEDQDDEDEDPLGDAGEVLKEVDYSYSVLEPPPFLGCKRIGGARRFVAVSSSALDGEGKRARYKVGSAIRIQDLRGGWTKGFVTNTDIREFRGISLWHYKLKDEDGKIDSKHWYPQDLVYSA